MKKKDFIRELKFKIRKLDKKEVEDIISYYSELIDDRIEQGENEEDIILSLGSIDLIAKNIFEEKNISNEDIEIVESEIVDNKKAKYNNDTTVLKILLLVLLFPLWISLGVFFLTILIIILSVFFAIAVSSIALIASGIFTLIGSFIHFAFNFGAGIIQLGVSFLIIALGLLLFSILPLFGKLGKGFIKIMKKGVFK